MEGESNGRVETLLCKILNTKRENSLGESFDDEKIGNR